MPINSRDNWNIGGCPNQKVCYAFYKAKESSPHIRPPTECIGLDQAVGVEGKQLHALWEDELTGRRRRRAVLAIACQHVGAVVDEIFLHRLRVRVHQATDGLLGNEVDHRVKFA